MLATATPRPREMPTLWIYHPDSLLPVPKELRAASIAACPDEFCRSTGSCNTDRRCRFEEKDHLVLERIFRMGRRNRNLHNV